MERRKRRGLETWSNPCCKKERKGRKQGRREGKEKEWRE